MMISPSTYIDEFKDSDYEALIEERDSLIAAIIEFEANERAGDRTGPEWMMAPNAEVVYQMNLEYLSEICKLMHERYNEEYVWGEKKLSD